MSSVTLWINWQGFKPTVWFEEIVRNGAGTGRMEQRPRADEDPATPFAFMARLSQVLGGMFRDTMGDAKAHPVDTRSAGPDNKHLIGPRDLLVYACRLRDSDSVMMRADKAQFDNLIAQNGINTAGMTGIVNGAVLSEAYFDKGNDGLVPLAENIYHEWMHNKTNRAGGESSLWVHKLDGLAVAKGGKGLTVRVKAAMKAHMHISNRQFVDRIS